MAFQNPGGVEQLLDGVGADDARLVEPRLVGLFGAGDRPRVTGGRLRAGVGPARLHDHDRGLVGHLAGGPDERLAVLDPLKVADDDVGPQVVAPRLDEVGLVEDRLVAQRDDVLEPEALVGGPLQHRGDERPRLAHKR